MRVEVDSDINSNTRFTMLIKIPRKDTTTVVAALAKHWEGDLLTGANDTHIATLVERKRRNPVNEALAGKPELVNEDAPRALAGSTRSSSPSLPNLAHYWIGMLISLTYGSRVDAVPDEVVAVNLLKRAQRAVRPPRGTAGALTRSALACQSRSSSMKYKPTKLIGLWWSDFVMITSLHVVETQRATKPVRSSRKSVMAIIWPAVRLHREGRPATPIGSLNLANSRRPSYVT
jgi:hypothetical protein